MANLQVKDIDDSLYNSLKQRAALERRSVSQEVVLIIEKYLSSPEQFEKKPTKDFENRNELFKCFNSNYS